MALKNRVDPAGNIISTPARGSWVGNRGVIHNKHKEIVRSFKIRAWITCIIEFRGRHREIMQPNRWTELFFLDEATAFSAGHRPCFQCRYHDHMRFRKAWLKGNSAHGFDDNIAIKAVDELLHKERTAQQKPELRLEEISQLPNGVFVAIDGVPYLVFENGLHRWTPFGYEGHAAITMSATVYLLTPPSIVNTFKAGYQPQIKKAASF